MTDRPGDTIGRCQTCGVTDRSAMTHCSDGFHAPGETYWPTLAVDDRELIEEVATTIDPVWMIPPQGPHPLDNYPGQADKYREKARQAARAVLQMPRLQSLLSEVEEAEATIKLQAQRICELSSEIMEMRHPALRSTDNG